MRGLWVGCYDMHPCHWSLVSVANRKLMRAANAPRPDRARGEPAHVGTIQAMREQEPACGLAASILRCTVPLVASTPNLYRFPTTSQADIS